MKTKAVLTLIAAALLCGCGTPTADQCRAARTVYQTWVSVQEARQAQGKEMEEWEIIAMIAAGTAYEINCGAVMTPPAPLKRDQSGDSWAPDPLRVPTWE